MVNSIHWRKFSGANWIFGLSLIIVRILYYIYTIVCCYLWRGWRPSYRNILLGVRKKLGIPCSSKLSTEDLEVEIFLHLLSEYSRYLSPSLLAMEVKDMWICLCNYKCWNDECLKWLQILSWICSFSTKWL